MIRIICFSQMHNLVDIIYKFKKLQALNEIW